MWENALQPTRSYSSQSLWSPSEASVLPIFKSLLNACFHCAAHHESRWFSSQCVIPLCVPVCLCSYTLTAKGLKESWLRHQGTSLGPKKPVLFCHRFAVWCWASIVSLCCWFPICLIGIKPLPNLFGVWCKVTIRENGKSGTLPFVTPQITAGRGGDGVVWYAGTLLPDCALCPCTSRIIILILCSWLELTSKSWNCPS